MTEIRGIYDTLDEARQEMEQDLIRDWGRDFFVEYEPDEDGEDEIRAVAPEGEEFRVYIDSVTTKARKVASAAPAAQAQSPPALSTMVYLFVANKKRYHDQEGYEQSIPEDRVCDPLLAANRAARDYILYDLTDGEGQGDREFSEKNQDSRDHPYSAAMYSVHDELDEVLVEVKPMSVVRSATDAAVTATSQQSSGAVKRSAPLGGSEQIANKQQRVSGTEDDDDEVVCLS